MTGVGDKDYLTWTNMYVSILDSESYIHFYTMNSESNNIHATNEQKGMGVGPG